MGLDPLAHEARWVAWRNELRGGTQTKVPYAPDGKRAKADDPATWGTRAEAEGRAKRIVNGQGGGIGIQLGDLGENTFLSGIDLDSCIADDGTLAPWAAAILNATPTYTERSPSGHGLKLFFYVESEDVRPFLDRIGADRWGVRRGIPGEDCRDHGPAVEVYLAGRFFAVTGDKWPGAPAELAMLDSARLDRLAPLIPPAKISGPSIRGGADNSRSAIAFRVGLATRRTGKTYEEFCEELRDDAQTANWYVEKGIAYGGRELHRIWQKAGADVGRVAGAPLVTDPKAPYDIARAFLDAHFVEGGQRTLHRHRGAFHAWNGTAYPEVDEAGLRAKIYDFLDRCVTVIRGETRPVKPNPRMVGNVLDALAAAAQLDTAIAAPAWLDHMPNFPADEIFSCANGLLHLPTLTLLRHTPALFTHNVVDFAFDRNAPAPHKWLDFLAALWPEDPAAVGTLQEIFGYCLTADTSQQKAFLLVGPKRSGKGTIARVLTHLVGMDNTVAPTLAGLGMNFGLAPLIGKRVAIISDARLGGRTDQNAIAERLLSITGEDANTIDRKFREAWTGRLQTRFLILSNELPRLADASGALASRFIVLVLTHSFFGREDRGLTARLLPELPSILNWAIAGWQRLIERGYFVMPASSDEAVQEFEDLGSPIGVFIRERCVVAPGRVVDTTRLFKSWCGWCKQQGRNHPGTAQTFGRDLRAALPGLKVRQPREEGGRLRLYEGIGLK